jgi:catechol 2,3-dioxygenase-like lactoylglutathione lyase family enzyme
MTIEVLGIDHVQLAMPRGEEPLARLFYSGILGLREVSRPRALRRKGGAWFVGRGVSIHLIAEEPFHAARLAHPALVVADLAAAIRRFENAGVIVEPDTSGVPVLRRYVWDPFGNRIELVDAADRGFSERRPPR